LEYYNTFTPAIASLPEVLQPHLVDCLTSATNYLDLRQKWKGGDATEKYETLAKLCGANRDRIEIVRHEEAIIPHVLKRDLTMAGRCLDVMRQRGKNLCILFLGSAHCQGISTYLHTNRISWVYYRQGRSGDADHG